MKTLVLALSAVLLAGVAPAATGQVGDLEVKIHAPLPDLVVTSSETSIEVRGGASVLGGVKQLDLFFVLDTSRSLRRTDPEDHRKAGAIGLVESLPAWSDIQFGVVAFDRKAELLSPLSGNRAEVVAALRALERKGATNLAGGIRLALEGFQQGARESSSRVILLFTDGRSNEKKALTAMNEARAQGVAIHTLLLGKDSKGSRMLSEIADGTGGDFIQVADPADLPDAFRNLRTAGVEGVTLRVNDSPPLPATLTLGSFTARVPLEAGENRIVATATSRDGTTKTDTVTVIVRPDGCAELLVQAMRDGKPALSISERAVEIVFDASGSMWGQLQGVAKIEIAKETLDAALDWLPPDLLLSLRAYGHQHRREAHNCEDTELLVPSGTDNRQQIRSAIAQLRPKGQTPLGYALEQIAGDHGSFEGERAVVLVTDGIESCGGDAPAAARALQQAGPVPVHVIGFGLEDAADEDLASLRAIAEASGGTFLTAGSADELRRALSTTVGTTFQVWRGSELVAQGTLGADEVMQLPAGSYRVHLDSRPPQEMEIALESEVHYRVVFQRDGNDVSHATWRDTVEYAFCENVAPGSDAVPAAPGENAPRSRRTARLEIATGSVEIWQNLRAERSADWGVVVRHPSLKKGQVMAWSGNDADVAERAAEGLRAALQDAEAADPVANVVRDVVRRVGSAESETLAR
ncbi:MAG: VWA domain-containing protein [Proteobacteria bacterium]|nr:VWA domain-containing protein [Pseudomonadota bacterium]